MRASDFIESIGVNAHIDQAGSTYAKSDVIGQMRYLGIDNMRVLAPYDQAGTLSTYTSLGQRGIKFDVVPFVNHGAAINLASDMSMIDSIAPYVRTVEGPNEINTDPLANYNGQSGVNAAIALQKDLYTAVHSDARLSGVSVLGFSLSVGGSVTGFGDISQFADYGNVHGYAGQGVPPYYMLDYARTSITTVTGKPVMMTETGNYTDFDGNSGVTQDVQAKWIMDTLLENASKGIAKTYIYQLEDNGFDTGAPYSENHYGMFTNDGTAKQSAVDVHNMTTILADTGSNAATFAPTALNYTVSGVTTDNTFSSAFAKLNGSYDVALWYEPQFYNAATGQASGVAAQNATVALGGTYNVKVFDPVAGTTAIATYQNVNSVNVALGTDPLIIEVSPVGSTIPAVVTPVPGTSIIAVPPVATPANSSPAPGTPVNSSSAPGTPINTGVTAVPPVTTPVDSSPAPGTPVNTGVTAVPPVTTPVNSSPALMTPANTGVIAAPPVTSPVDSSPAPGTPVNTGVTAVPPVTSPVDSSPAPGTPVNTGVTAVPPVTNPVNSSPAPVTPVNTVPAVTTPVISVATAAPTTLGSGSSIAVSVSEDAYEGDAQFTIAVDGIQIGGILTATASHAAGQTQVFNVLGAFGAGSHKVTVDLLHDTNAATKRNLYVDSITADGVTKAAGLTLYSNGSQSFTTSSVIGPATLASNPTLAFVTAVNPVTIDGGTTAGTTLTGGPTRNLFVLHAGTSSGDIITNFTPSLTAGDFLELRGYGSGATLVQVDTTTWIANSGSGAIHDVIKMTNGAVLIPANILFA